MADSAQKDAPHLLKIDTLERRVSVLEKVVGGVPAVSGVYQHNQTHPSATWTVNHNLGYFPNVRVVDTGGNTIDGQIADVDNNSLTINFFLSGAPYALIGKAYLS